MVGFDACWTDEEIERRRAAIRGRKTFPESSPEYRAHHAIVVELHRAATRRFVEKAPTVLSESELDRFRRVMVPSP